MPSSPTSAPVPLPLENGVYHQDFEFDGEIQRSVIRRPFVESSTPPNSSSNTLFATNGRLAFTSLNEHLLTKIGELTSVRQAFNPSQTITCEARNQRAAL